MIEDSGPVVMAMAPCFGCGTVFWFNPVAVPSFTPPGKDHSQRQPVCGRCMALVNAKRVADGREPWPIRPDAYEPLPAEQLP